MTTVLPLPVAILKATRFSSGLWAWLVGLLELPENPCAVLAVGDFGEVDGGFQSFDLAEEEAALAVGVGPVFEELAGGVSNAGVAAETPFGDGGPHFVDELVLFDPFLGPLVIEGQLRSLLLRLGHGDEVAAQATRLDHFVGDAVLVEVEMAVRLFERRVQDGVGNDHLSHKLC